jgi:hypothetical protein
MGLTIMRKTLLLISLVAMVFVLTLFSDSTGKMVEVMKTGRPKKGTRIELPPGALEKECDVSIGLVKNPTSLPGNMKSVSHIIDLGPDGNRFKLPVWITFPLTKEDLDRANAGDLSEVKMFTFSGGSSPGPPQSNESQVVGGGTGDGGGGTECFISTLTGGSGF